jgi:multiple sugar transport system ATP-binding protein
MTMATRIAVINKGLLQQVDTPQNLYDSPANQFVAGFIGSPAMNFFGDDPNLPPVRLVGSADDLWADGGTFKVKVPADKAPALSKHLNREVILGIRPEECYDRQFALNATPDNTVRVNVDVVEPMGSEVYLYLLTGKKVFVGRLDSRTQVQPGQSIEIVWDMTKVHFFEKESQAALV